MSKETNLKKLREIIIKANPDILKLEFGCEIKTEFGILLYQSEFHGTTCGGKMMPQIPEYYFYDEEEQKIQCFFSKEDFEIIGRKITLADVLITLAKNNIVSELGIFVDVIGRFWKIKPCGGKNEMRIMCRWELFRASDNLNNQSSGTIKWLLGILDN